MPDKILVIDDDPTLRLMIKHTLIKHGHEVLEAEDGEPCQALVRQHQPAMVICDVKMGKVDGYQVLQSLRSDPATASVPLILITAEAGKAGLRQGMAMGADDYLPKPFTAAELLAAVGAQQRKAAVRVQEAEKKLTELRASLNLALPHELFTPLNGIMGCGDVLLSAARTLTPEEIEDIARDLVESAERLQGLVQNYLFYAQLENLASDPKQGAILRSAHSSSIVEELETGARSLAKRAQRDADLLLTLQDANVAMSKDYLLKAANELIENAFKFSKPGAPVLVETSVREQQFIFRLQDHGKGMTAKQIASIGAYSQFGRGSQEQQGTGLGLVIAKRLTELHNGWFDIASQGAGAGTLITLKLPLAA